MSRMDKIIEMLQQTPEDDFLQHALALEYMKLDNKQKAEELFREILKRNPNYIGSYYQLAKLLEEKNQTEEAKQVYETGMKYAKQCNDDFNFKELQRALEALTMD